MFFNMPKKQNGLGATIIEGIKARENALKSPEDAARYLNDQNNSSWVSDEEADVVIKSMIKFSASKSDAKKFLSEWNIVSGGPIKLKSATWTQSFKQKIDNIAFLGDKITKLALEDINKTVTASVPPSPSAVGPIAPSYVSDTSTGSSEYLSPPKQIPVSANAPETESKKMITNTNVNIRSSPSVNGDKITTLSQNASVSVSNKDTGGEWTRIIYKGSPAYLLTKYLSNPSAKKPASQSNQPSAIVKKQQDQYQQEDMSTSNKLLIAVGILGVAGAAYYMNRSEK
jgi:uncharacterized protein YgiM (DUF1202 family)